jgi:hypothetical protein
MLAEFNSRPAWWVTEALNVRTMVGNDLTVGFPNCSIVTRIVMYKYNSMYMIRHDHKHIHIHMREMDQNLVPTFLYDFAQRIDPHGAVHHLAEQAFPPHCHDGDEIPACLRIIISFQADGFTVVDFWIEFCAY